ncbi:MAG: hypothetical protein LBJ31_02585 [Treponema sp.]|jgi:hypothetical protein|nr:hypothetical protein [Treponema sp.]
MRWNGKRLAVILGFFFFGCAHEKAPPPEAGGLTSVAPLPQKQNITPADYQGREAGQNLPPWLLQHLAGERIETSYPLFFCFVHETRGRLDVISQWMRNFKPDYDVSRLIAARIRLRLDQYSIGQDPGATPDQVYGRSYEDAVKTAYNTVFWGAERSGECWILDAEGVYRGYILILIPRDTLAIQIKALLASIRTDSARDQEFARAIERFFERF